MIACDALTERREAHALADAAAVLIVFGGLPGTGKSTLAALLARERAATWLRIDSIEQALRASGTLRAEVGPAGYLVAYALAETNLRLGQAVVADCVNPLEVTRHSWRQVAAAAAVPIIEVEVICSDPVEHRRRVETRVVDVPGLVAPDWEAVLRRRYEPWAAPPIVLDTAGRDVAAAAAELSVRIAQAARPYSTSGV